MTIIATIQAIDTIPFRWCGALFASIKSLPISKSALSQSRMFNFTQYSIRVWHNVKLTNWYLLNRSNHYGCILHCAIRNSHMLPVDETNSSRTFYATILTTTKTKNIHFIQWNMSEALVWTELAVKWPLVSRYEGILLIYLATATYIIEHLP